MARGEDTGQPGNEAGDVGFTDCPTPWSWQDAIRACHQVENRLPVFARTGLSSVVTGLDVWDMWPIALADGSTLRAEERTFWFFLAAPRFDDPEDRHHAAHIRLTSLGREGWCDLGRVFSAGFTPGSREWSGSAVLDNAGRTLTIFFTAAGRRGASLTFEQRLIESRCEFRLDGNTPVLGTWSTPIESVQADGNWYARADQADAAPHGIKGFRDPGYFRDPADGSHYLLFAGSAGWAPQRFDGVIGLAERIGSGWSLRRPLVEALGVNSELERPHVIFRDSRYYLFWSTHARRFAPKLGAPTGLYAMVADRFRGPWRPVNGSGLVAANPLQAPLQAYCWWVTAEGAVLSFVDYPGAQGTEPPVDPKERRIAFGGTAAPVFQLEFAGERVTSVIPSEW